MIGSLECGARSPIPTFDFAERIEGKIGGVLCPSAIVLKATPRHYFVVSANGARSSSTPVGVETDEEMVLSAQIVTQHVGGKGGTKATRENHPLSGSCGHNQFQITSGHMNVADESFPPPSGSLLYLSCSVPSAVPSGNP